MSDWDEIKRVLLDGSSEEVLSLKCPDDSAPLRIEISGRKRISLGASCVRCRSGVRMDGLDVLPKWVEKLGKSFQTDG